MRYRKTFWLSILIFISPTAYGQSSEDSTLVSVDTSLEIVNTFLKSIEKNSLEDQKDNNDKRATFYRYDQKHAFKNVKFGGSVLEVRKKVKINKTSYSSMYEIADADYTT